MFVSNEVSCYDLQKKRRASVDEDNDKLKQKRDEHFLTHFIPTAKGTINYGLVNKFNARKTS